MAEHGVGSESSRFAESNVSDLGYRTFFRRCDGFVGKYMAQLLQHSSSQEHHLVHVWHASSWQLRLCSSARSTRQQQLESCSDDDDLVPHFPSVASVSILNGPYHHGVEAFYSQEATSVYSPHKECHGKPYNEDATCSFSELTRSVEKHKTYFSIPVGTFWETDCVL